MATTDLSSKSLGDILLQSGIGTPDHTSPLGSLYTDKNTGYVWRKLSGSTSWEKLATVAYGVGYYQDNATTTTITTINTWTAVNNNFTQGLSKGFSANTDTIVLIAGYDGDYEIRGNVTLDYNAGAANYEAGISVNGANPSAGEYGGAYVDATYTRQYVGFQTIRNLTGGTTLELAVRNLTSSADVTIRHAQILARRV